MAITLKSRSNQAHHATIDRYHIDYCSAKFDTKSRDAVVNASRAAAAAALVTARIEHTAYFRTMRTRRIYASQT